MSQTYIQVNIVTPNGVVFSHRAKFVSVQTTNGGLTILPNHLPIVTALTISQVVVERKKESAKTNYIAVDGGLLEFNHNVCNIIANTAERARDINVERAQETLKWAQEEIHKAEEAHDTIRLQRARLALNKAINRIGTSNKYRR